MKSTTLNVHNTNIVEVEISGGIDVSQTRQI